MKEFVTRYGIISLADIDMLNVGNWAYLKNTGTSGGLKLSTGNGSGVLTDGISISSGGNYIQNHLPTQMLSGLKSGDVVGGNYTEFGVDGTLVMNGTATVFDDVTYDAVQLVQAGPGISLNTTELTVDYLTTANSADFMIANIQLPHARKNGAVVYPHIHFFQSQAGAPNFAIQYRWQKNLLAKTTAWTALKCNTLSIPYTAGTINQIAYVNGGITPSTGDTISDIIQFKIIRDTSNQLGLAYGADPYPTVAAVISFDIHIEKDTLGSKEEYVK